MTTFLFWSNAPLEHKNEISPSYTNKRVTKHPNILFNIYLQKSLKIVKPHGNLG